MSEQLPVGNVVLETHMSRWEVGTDSRDARPRNVAFEAEMIKLLKAQRDMIDQMLRALGEVE